MPPSLGTSLAATLRRLAAIPDGLADRELLARFVAKRDEAAFAAIVRRHGGLVFDVCRNILRNHADAEDAFQSTFLALAAQAGQVRNPAALSGWLHATACRTALKARRSHARRMAHETHAPVRPDVAAPDPTLAEALAAVHEEVDRLPERYRAAIVLFELAGRTQDEVGQALGLSKDGVKKRLERGRARLRAALGRRGFGPAVIVAAATSAVEVPTALAEAVARFVASSGDAPLSVSHGVWPMSAKIFSGSASTVVVAAVAGFGLLWGGPPEKAPTPVKGEGPAPTVGELIPVPPREVAGASRKDLFGDPLPAGAVLRLGTVGFRVPDAAGVGFRKNGQLVAVSEDLRLYEWPADGSATPTVTPLTEDAQYGWRRALSADARFVAVANGHKIAVWDVSGPKPSVYLAHEEGDVSHLALAANGSRLAACDGNIHLCDLATKTWAKFPALVPFAESLSFTPDGRWLTVATAKDVIVIDAAAAKERCRVVIPKVRPHFAALSSDGGTLAVLSTGWLLGPPATVRFFAIPSGDELTTLKSPAGPAQWVGFAPDGKTLLLGNPHGVREWDFVTGKLVREIDGPGTHPAAFSPDGRRMAAHSRAAVMLVDRVKGTHVHPELYLARP